MFRGTTHTSHFNFGTTEDTYIRGGKDGSHVIINDGAQGDVGIGTANPQAQLHVNKTGEALRISGFNSSLSVYDNSGNGVGFILNNSGSIDLGTFVANTNGEVRLKTKGQSGLTVQSDDRVRVGALGCNLVINAPVGDGNQAPKLSVHGPIGIKKSFGDQMGEWAMGYVSWNSNFPNALAFAFNGGIKALIDEVDGSWETFSDLRLKENFENYKSVLDGIRKLDVFTYHYKADKTGRRSFGLVAQNLKQHFPALVSGSEENGSYLGISYGKTGVLAIKAIQEQQVIIEEQQKRIEMLEKRLSALENKARVP